MFFRRGAPTISLASAACFCGTGWNSFVKVDSIKLKSILNPVEKGLVDRRLVQQEHVLTNVAIAKEDSAVCSMAKSGEAVSLINHAGIIEDDGVEEVSSLLQGMLTERKSCCDKDLCILHSSLNSLVSIWVVFARCFKRILLIKIITSH